MNGAWPMILGYGWFSSTITITCRIRGRLWGVRPQAWGARRWGAAAVSARTAGGAAAAAAISAAQSVVSVRLRRNPLRGSDLGRAEGAAASRERDLAQALGARPGRRLRRGAPRVQGVHRLDHDEEDRRRDEDERDHRVDEGPVQERAVVDGEGERGEVVAAEDGGDERGDDVGYQGRDDGPERDPDDHRDRQVDDVA